jgi:hypothetical protein
VKNGTSVLAVPDSWLIVKKDKLMFFESDWLFALIFRNHEQNFTTNGKWHICGCNLTVGQ